MRIAWFRAGKPTRTPSVTQPSLIASGHAFASTAPPLEPEPWDDTGLLICTLRARHDLDLIDETRAHEFVWQHARRPWDLCVYELDGTPAQQFAAAYAAHYAGIAILRGAVRHERALLASRLVVVPQDAVAQLVADDLPGVRVRTLVPGVEPLRDAEEVVEALRWPPDGTTLPRAIAAFGAARAVIVFEGVETADLPALDPRTWRLREPIAGTRRDAICVSVDPRDAEGLRLARERLHADSGLRRELGAAARAWWHAHATVAAATAAFEDLLEEARNLDDPVGVPVDDGMNKARSLLAEAGIDLNTLKLGTGS